MLVYSITSRESFEEAQAMYKWITRIRNQEMPVVCKLPASSVCLKRPVIQALYGSNNEACVNSVAITLRLLRLVHLKT